MHKYPPRKIKPYNTHVQREVGEVRKAAQKIEDLSGSGSYQIKSVKARSRLLFKVQFMSEVFRCGLGLFNFFSGLEYREVKPQDMIDFEKCNRILSKYDDVGRRVEVIKQSNLPLIKRFLYKLGYIEYELITALEI